MTQTSPDDRDRGMQGAIGGLLRAGVLLAAAIVVAGMIGYLVTSQSTHVGYGVFVGVGPALSSLYAVARSALHLHAAAVMQLGLIVLILTPVARVALSAVAFARERDRLYVALTLVVLAILLFGLTGHSV